MQREKKIEEFEFDSIVPVTVHFVNRFFFSNFNDNNNNNNCDDDDDDDRNGLD